MKKSIYFLSLLLGLLGSCASSNITADNATAGNSTTIENTESVSREKAGATSVRAEQQQVERVSNDQQKYDR